MMLPLATVVLPQLSVPGEISTTVVLPLSNDAVCPDVQVHVTATIMTGRDDSEGVFKAVPDWSFMSGKQRRLRCISTASHAGIGCTDCEIFFRMQG